MFNGRGLFLASLPVLNILSKEERYKCWFWGKSYTPNKLENRIHTVQYNANSPIEDRISYRDLKNAQGYAALVLDGHGGWQVVPNGLFRPSSSIIVSSRL